MSQILIIIRHTEAKGGIMNTLLDADKMDKHDQYLMRLSDQDLELQKIRKSLYYLKQDYSKHPLRYLQDFEPSKYMKVENSKLIEYGQCKNGKFIRKRSDLTFYHIKYLTIHHKNHDGNGKKWFLYQVSSQYSSNGGGYLSYIFDTEQEAYLLKWYFEHLQDLEKQEKIEMNIKTWEHNND